ncbi:hypothetical protein H310_10124 [Aphanomyces invadans]|uniref:Uncharacterized protein n=1 Tax=Aphanomyces invadans TaxID=157072 RepID=A0A024TRR6_9STRA|nr:hypothetical protein H310_10124 [Aphanomyces invadans]ETV96835.1 hypothetical protein H310_10124 [Aphanomyces invadans]|eukprot:XP_008874612.1 hypothetical protein H310_10124 [Aphanomyces invadans]
MENAVGVGVAGDFYVQAYVHGHEELRWIQRAGRCVVEEGRVLVRGGRCVFVQRLAQHGSSKDLWDGNVPQRGFDTRLSDELLKKVFGEVEIGLLLSPADSVGQVGG